MVAIREKRILPKQNGDRSRQESHRCTDAVNQRASAFLVSAKGEGISTIQEKENDASISVANGCFQKDDPLFICYLYLRQSASISSVQID